MAIPFLDLKMPTGTGAGRDRGPRGMILFGFYYTT